MAEIAILALIVLMVLVGVRIGYVEKKRREAEDREHTPRRTSDELDYP